MCLPELLDDSATTDTKASDQGAPLWENRPADKYHDAPGSSFRLSRGRHGSFRRILPAWLASLRRTPVEIALFRRAVLRLLCMVSPWHNPLTFLGNYASCLGTRQ